jgi:hypothetical protein
VQQRVEVPAGAHRVQVAWQAKDLGEASILAQADGFEAGSARVQAVTPVAIAQQWQVTVSDAVFAPGKQSGAGILVIQATDSRGNPAAMPCGPLYLSSSDVSVARVPPEAVGLCKDPLEPLTVPLEVTGLPGKASITVSSMGLLAATAQVTTAGTRPARLLVERGPAMPNSADPATAVLAMQLVGDNGVPVALHPGARISLLAEGAQLPPAADLVAGAAFVEVPVTARGGPVSITAVTERYGTTTDEFELRAPAMSASIASTGEGAVQTVNVHVTASGQPVAGAKVELDSDGSMQSAVTGPDGTASFQVTVAVDEMPVMVTARLQGYEDAVATTVLSPAFAFSGGATAPPYLLYGFLALACVAFLVYQAIGWRRQRMTGPEGRVS